MKQDQETLFKPQPVWDIFVRIFHWSLVCCICSNYFFVSDGKTLHQWTGYSATSLVLLRIMWGFLGSQHARFKHFLPNRQSLLTHISQLKSGKHEASVGHNPLGAIMILMLLTVVIFLGLTGWMQTLDAFWGEQWLQNTHSVLANIMIGLAFVHILAALIMGNVEKTRLIKAMFTGTKERR